MVCAPVRRDNRTGAYTMLYLTCTMISSEDLEHYGVSRAKAWVFVDCGTIQFVVYSPNRKTYDFETDALHCQNVDLQK